MPAMDGCNLSRQLRALYGDDIVLVAVTGYDENNQRVAEAFATVDHSLKKPIDLEALHKILPPLQ